MMFPLVFVCGYTTVYMHKNGFGINNLQYLIYKKKKMTSFGVLLDLQGWSTSQQLLLCEVMFLENKLYQYIHHGSNISSTESDVDISIGKLWTATDSLTTLWKFNDWQYRAGNILMWSRISHAIWLHLLDFKIIPEKTAYIYIYIYL